MQVSDQEVSYPEVDALSLKSEKGTVINMINFREKNTTIGTIVAGLPEAAAIFKEVGIDYCCGGNRKLAKVMKEQELDEGTVYDRLEKAFEERKAGYQNNDFASMEPKALSTYIEDTHHSYMWKALPEVAEILEVVLRAHGRNHQELFQVYRLYGSLKTELEQHLLKEETILFPVFSDNASPKEERLSLAKDIISEHVAAGEILSELRRITNDYTVPADACGTFQRAYEMLEEMEQDLHQHIHLENNILLKEYDYR